MGQRQLSTSVMPNAARHPAWEHGFLAALGRDNRVPARVCQLVAFDCAIGDVWVAPVIGSLGMGTPVPGRPPGNGGAVAVGVVPPPPSKLPPKPPPPRPPMPDSEPTLDGSRLMTSRSGRSTTASSVIVSGSGAAGLLAAPGVEFRFERFVMFFLLSELWTQVLCQRCTWASLA